MRSALYEGELSHHRIQPAHGFRRRVAMPLLDLAEIDDVVAQHRLWSRERPNAVSFRRSDFLGDPATDLDATVRDLVEAESGYRPDGPIALLAHLRTWGWLFNPIALYYCFDSTGTHIQQAIAHVTNTPWKEQHAYVLGRPGTHRVAKAMHVSPFFGMEQSYRITYSEPDDELRLAISVHEHDDMVFTSGLRLRRRPITPDTLGRILWRHPLLTVRISAGIHAHALRLWGKGARFHTHPSKATQEVTDARSSHHAQRADTAA